MSLKQCVKCSEMVDQAKAFCPGCGAAFVDEEKRIDESSFESMDSTVQLGQTMYNQMLSDMGLDTKTPKKKRVEIIEPVEEYVVPVEKTTEKPKSNAKWFILGGLLVILLFAAIVIAIAVFMMYWSR